MKLLIINQFFYPDIAATAQMVTDLAEDLSEEDFEITVLTSNSNYLGGTLNGSRTNGKHFKANVIRLNSLSFGRARTLGRIMDYMSFYILALIKSLLLPKPDLALILTTPPLIGCVGWILKLIKRTRYVCLVQDLYPDTAIALGVLRANSLVAKISDAVANAIYRKADHIIAISENMRVKIVQKRVEPARMSIISNWADKRQIYPVAKSGNWFAAKHSLTEYFTVQYSGNMGLGHDFRTFIGAMEKLRARPDIKFIFIGDGKRKAEVLKAKEELGLENVVLLPYQERKNLPYSIGAGDVSLISLKSALNGCIVPCKLYGIMAAARPVIYVGDSTCDVARIIKEANCGFQVNEGDIDGFVGCLLKLVDDPKLTEALGQNGFHYFLANYDREKATGRYFNLLRDLIEN